MLIDGGIGFDPGGIDDQARRVEQQGYDGAWAAETGHDPLLTLALAAGATERLELGTGIVVAFGRSPMITATMANDVQLLTKGRLLLGLGSQIKPHIERRYSMPWSHPAPRMKEYIQALHAIWDCWQSGGPLDFRGDFYTFNLMTPFFNPGPNPYGKPKVFLAAVGELMTQVAGEVADGILIHGFTTERYMREVTMPAIDKGLRRAGRDRSAFQVSYPGFVVTGETEEEVARAKAAVKAQIAFYGSTPAYRPVLEAHGWGDLQSQLHPLSRQGEWQKMAELVDDEVLDAFAVVAPPDQVAATVRERFGDMIDRFSFYAPYGFGGWERVLEGFRS
ncbi:MAG TPA: TIGR03617 family F420-dependent LLM class oxidoreductase [Acidimicrobiales bacterium]|nr:TIGR03617 family F420-dependent LLM class oxidoreductase [Acidimicrobiales bacterium]